MESASRRSKRLTLWFCVMLKVCLPFGEDLGQDKDKIEEKMNTHHSRCSSGVALSPCAP